MYDVKTIERSVIRVNGLAVPTKLTGDWLHLDIRFPSTRALIG